MIQMMYKIANGMFSNSKKALRIISCRFGNVPNCRANAMMNAMILLKISNNEKFP